MKNEKIEKEEKNVHYSLFPNGDCRYTRKYATTCMSVSIFILYDYTYMLSKTWK